MKSMMHLMYCMEPNVRQAIHWSLSCFDWWFWTKSPKVDDGGGVDALVCEIQTGQQQADLSHPADPRRPPNTSHLSHTHVSKGGKGVGVLTEMKEAAERLKAKALRQLEARDAPCVFFVAAQWQFPPGIVRGERLAWLGAEEDGGGVALYEVCAHG
jgi:hypothetical protein